MDRDKLDLIFELQNKFDTDLAERRNLTEISMEEWIQKETLALMAELAELIDEVNYKWWKNAREIDMDKVKNELVDVLHFFVSMCLKTGMTSQELTERYCEKNKENFNRQYGKSQKKGYES